MTTSSFFLVEKHKQCCELLVEKHKPMKTHHRNIIVAIIVIIIITIIIIIIILFIAIIMMNTHTFRPKPVQALHPQEDPGSSRREGTAGRLMMG